MKKISPRLSEPEELEQNVFANCRKGETQFFAGIEVALLQSHNELCKVALKLNTLRALGSVQVA